MCYGCAGANGDAAAKSLAEALSSGDEDAAAEAISKAAAKSADCGGVARALTR